MPSFFSVIKYKKKNFCETSQGWKYYFFVSKVGFQLDTDATFPLYIQNHEKVWQSETWVLSHFEPQKVIKSFLKKLNLWYSQLLCWCGMGLHVNDMNMIRSFILRVFCTIRVCPFSLQFLNRATCNALHTLYISFHIRNMCFRFCVTLNLKTDIFCPPNKSF